MAVSKKKDRTKRSEWKAYHASAMRVAQTTYDFHDPDDIVYESYSVPEGHVYTATTPSRVAWEAYFDAMTDFGQDPWRGRKRFEKELKR